MDIIDATTGKLFTDAFLPERTQPSWAVQATLAQSSLDAIRQIVREESRPDTFAQKILRLINTAYGEMEQLGTYNKMMDRLQDAVEEIKALCEQRVQGATQPL